MSENTQANAVDPSTEDITDLTLELLSHDTSNPPGETADIVDFVQTDAESAGLQTERITVDPAKPNLLVRVPGESARTLLYLGHLDTVPFDEREWRHDPLGERVDDRLYGRGATDMKGPAAALLSTVRQFAETETTPPVSLMLALVSDEEVAGEAGLPAVLEKLEARGTVADIDACVIGETTTDEEHYSVTVADRGSIWLTLTATGTAAHGSRPVLGENAIDVLYGAVETIRERFGSRPLDIPAEVEPIIEDSIAYYSPAMGEERARELFAEPSLNLGTIEGGESINSVPATAQAEIDIRLSPGVQTPSLLGDLRDCVADCEGIEVSAVSWSIGTYEPPDSAFVEAVASVARDVTGERIYRRSATGGGDAKKLRNAGIPTVEFAVGTDTVHAVDEYTTVDALAENAAIYTQFPYAYADQSVASTQ